MSEWGYQITAEAAASFWTAVLFLVLSACEHAHPSDVPNYELKRTHAVDPRGMH